MPTWIRELTPEPHSNRTVLSLVGTATFLRLPRLAAALEKVPESAELHVDFEQLEYIDHACLDLLMNWAKQHEATGGRLVIDWDSLHAQLPRRTGAPTASCITASNVVLAIGEIEDSATSLKSPESPRVKLCGLCRKV